MSFSITQCKYKNAKAMAEGFMKRGYDFISEGTDNHTTLIDLRNKNITGKRARKCFSKSGDYGE